ncbi:succinylglutamate desuccinylase/aspartoacylase family protein [Pseudoduganella violaceinigra]|uniref:succinylglutamate desuccinylase/aspartoacylase family protein n=1 Tax=Pseudoduganella violaceinigra TaxID=246602 RepID=UPI0004075BA9|nr:succinylglutamate desuccinylase/aspartoacylase family protein [Pseudoduganella violaceinigra]
METVKTPLSAPYGSVYCELTSYHFGKPGGPKAYIQAALHADEVPAMLVAQELRKRLQALDAAGKVTGEVILVPAANPIGLAQVINERPFGRFDLSNGINFNRGYPHYFEQLKTRLLGQLGSNAEANVRTIRRHLRELVALWQPTSDATTLKKALLEMAIDADVVLDMHCENEGELHLYVGTALCEIAQPLSKLMGACAVLHTSGAGGEPFDEACSRLWWDLAEHFGPDYPIPSACMAATVELRGEVSVSYELAARDAQAIIGYLHVRGMLDAGAVTVPEHGCAPTPLEGVQRLDAPHAGMLVYLKEVGDKVRAGEVIADLIDPVSGDTTHLKSEVDGVLFTRLSHRYIIRGMNVAKIAGAEPFRSGSLLSL